MEGHVQAPDCQLTHMTNPHDRHLSTPSFPSSCADTLSYVRKVMTRHGFKFRTIDSGMTMCKKGEALEAFQTDPPTTIFLLNANVATVGLNLTAANNIILVR